MIAPLDSCFEAVYYDGETTARHAVAVELVDAGLELTRDGEDPVVWPYQSCRIAGGGTHGEPVRLERIGSPVGEAVVVESERLVDALRQRAPERFAATRLDRLYAANWSSVVLLGLAIVVVSGFLYFGGGRAMADLAARFAPPAVEERLGRTVVNTLAPEATRCKDARREELLGRIVKRLEAASGSGYHFRVLYSSSGVVNAFAAPGGYIVVFRGLLERVETPEELAGVLAHEMQHVIHKHSTRAIARVVSARTLLSWMAVDSSGSPAAMQGAIALANLHYQRSDEDEADRDSVPMLARAGIRPDALATFLRKLEAGKKGPSLAPAYLSSHPALFDRVAETEAAARKLKVSPRPLLTPEEWEEARTVCR